VRRSIAVLGVLLLGLTACGPEDPAEEPVPEDPDFRVPDEPLDPAADDLESERPEPPEGFGDLEHQAIAVAVQAGYDDQDLEVVTIEDVTWSDGALGCPQPGEMYTQALVDGYRVILRTQDGERLHVHGAEGQPPFLCEDPQEPVGS
jgi:hypothetical protein